MARMIAKLFGWAALFALPGRVNQLEKHMAKLDDELAQIKNDLTDTKNVLDGLVTTVPTLLTTIQDQSTQIQALKDQLAGAGLTADQQAALDALVTQADAVDQAAKNVQSALPAQTGTVPPTA